MTVRVIKQEAAFISHQLIYHQGGSLGYHYHVSREHDIEPRDDAPCLPRTKGWCYDDEGDGGDHFGTVLNNFPGQLSHSSTCTTTQEERSLNCTHNIYIWLYASLLLCVFAFASGLPLSVSPCAL